MPDTDKGTLMEDRLFTSAVTFIRNIDKDHPAFKDIDLSIPAEELIKQVAAA